MREGFPGLVPYKRNRQRERALCIGPGKQRARVARIRTYRNPPVAFVNQTRGAPRISFQNLEPQIHEYRSDPSWGAVVTLVRTQLWNDHPLNCGAVLSQTTSQLQEVYDKKQAAAPAKPTAG